MTGFTSRMGLAVAGMVLMAAPMAFAQVEVGAQNLSVKKVYVLSRQGDITPPMKPQTAAAFTPLVISCPGNGDCIAQMTVSAALGSVLEGQSINVRLRVDGQLAYPNLPSAFEDVPFIEAWVFASEHQTTRSFTWIKEITPGNHTVTVEVYSTNGNGFFGGRTLSISVLK